MSILPISEKYNDYAQKVAQYLKTKDVRAEIDNRNEKIGRKIRDNEIKHIPYLLVVGEKEEANNTVSVRKQGAQDLGIMTMEDFAKKINEEVAELIKID